MIGLFPTPLPNELWYSVCARYAKIVNFSWEGFCTELLDKKNIRISIDLPSSLQTVVSKLPQGHQLTTEKIINNHTLLPFYAPFLPKEIVSKILDLMINKNGKTIHSIARISTSTITIPKYLRFCPDCLQRNYKEFGISYWHRLHQVPGVLVCPEHKMFLEDSTKPVNPANKIQLFCADNNLILNKPRKLDLDNKVHKSLLLIAEDVKWLLDQEVFSLKNDHFKTNYLDKLSKSGFYKNNRGIEVKELGEHIKSYYSEELLNILQSNWESDNRNGWIYNIHTCLGKYQKVLPIRHLLLIHALGDSPSSFFSDVLAKETKVSASLPEKDFVDGPYPCLNPVCKNFHKLCIKEYEIAPDLNSEENFIIISCKCGFKYRRRGKDKSFQDIFRKTWVINYGALWEQTLTKLWNDKNLTLTQITKILLVKSITLKWVAASLGLEFPRQVKGYTSVGINTEIQARLTKKANKEKINQTKFIKTRNSKRKEWLKILSSNPKAVITELRLKIAPALTQWLDLKDKEWFKSHHPKVNRISSKLDWEDRDRFSVENIKMAVQSLMAVEGKPVWICKYSISRFFEKPNWIIYDRFLNKMPLTEKLLTEVIESRLEYNLRKIKYAVEQIKKAGGSSKPYRIAEKAHVHQNFRDVIEIKLALEEGQKQIEVAKRI